MRLLSRARLSSFCLPPDSGLRGGEVAEDDDDVVGVPSLEEQIYLYLDLCTPRARLSRPAVTEARANFLAASPERQWCVW